MTVAELQQKLNAALSEHKPDATIARQLGGFELTERLTAVTLSQLKGHLVPGSRAAVALELLADRSAFLDAPASESPDSSVPDSAEQNRIVAAAHLYVSQSLLRLPDFFATRMISLYDDRPQSLKKGEWPTRSGLHLIGTSSGEISVRNERDNQPATQDSSVWQANIGLISGGEFGNTLGMVFADTAKGSISWSHWEESTQGRLAVFKYEVPAPASHYEVLSALRREQTIEGFDSPNGASRGISVLGTKPNPGLSSPTIVRTRPGYHGSIRVDPIDGTILRITIDADLTKGTPFRRAALLVDYGPVDIAGATFICPVRSIALSKALDDPDTITGDAPTEWLNETHFTNYHRFGSTSRILAGDSAPPSKAGAESAGTDATGESAPQPVSSATPGTKAASAPFPNMQPPNSSAYPSGGGSSVESPPANVTATSPATGQAAAIIPGYQPPNVVVAPPSTIQDSAVTLHVEASELLIPVVVRDKQGRPVGNLSKGDFKVFDQGKIRDITGFTLITSDAAEGAQSNSATAGSAVGASREPVKPESAQNRFIIFLFDDLHISSSDLANAQKAIAQILDEPLPANEFEAVLSFTGVNSGITRDRTLLQAAVKKLTVHRAFQSNARDCPDIDYYSADKILNQHDEPEFQAAIAKVRACNGGGIITSGSHNGIDNPTSSDQRLAISAAAHALASGEEDARQSLLSIGSVVNAMSKLPGQRTLILVSPGFLSISPEAMTFKSQLLGRAAIANVVISALDARGLYVGNVDASQGGQSVTGQTSQGHLAALQASDSAMAELAYGTGGTFFHNNNDLESGLKTLIATPEFLYLLDVSLKDVKPTGSYHQLRVEIDKRGLDVLSRRGYFAPKAASMKR